MKKIILTLLLPLMFSHSFAKDVEKNEIIGAQKINSTTIEIVFSENQRMTFDFYGDNIFRVFQDKSGGIIRDPESKPEAQILVNNPRKALSKLELKVDDTIVTIVTAKVKLQLDKKTSLLKVIDLRSNKVVMEEVKPVLFEKGKVTVTLKEGADEYFYGGGVQNGRFSHKGKVIDIENQNSWTDGGVASPNPYYWSTNGYAVMWYTFKKGRYDFGAKEEGLVTLYHESDYLDVFYMVGDGAVALLNDFYQLTGNPVLIPKFGFYMGHLNAYNRDYWKEDEKGILFEDGKRYKEGQKDNGGVKESLNGENNNYQFSARAVIDRYSAYDMPLGWILVNDGYGAGYGQTETLDGNVQNLSLFADYAHEHGVEIGLWTQSDLHPKPEISALLQRDIVKEVRDASVRVLKTDVAWVGAGYSFGLNGVADAANIMTYYGGNSRPFIISLDGWAGTQRYATIWSGDQTGGVWEYIRFHIPTYIGSGLSGQPNITSDMDGIFGGLNLVVNARDYQWKSFTPMELNMDGWGSNEKYPHALGEPATSINRCYLKLKSELMPYAYSIAKEAVDGMPMIRAMFLEYPNAYTLGKATQYQFLYGPNFLVAPIYKETKVDSLGNDIRDGIYLPEGSWVDYFTGEKYEGGSIMNSFDAPLWKLPVFVKNGAIIPLANPNNRPNEIDNGLRIYEIYPYGASSFTEYDDDGVTQEYMMGRGVTTLIESNVDEKNNVEIMVHPTKGDFNGFVKQKTTEFRINVTQKPSKLSARVGGKKVKLEEVGSMEDFISKDNVFFFNAAPNLNQFATKNPQLLVKLASVDVTASQVALNIQGFVFEPADRSKVNTGVLSAPLNAQVLGENIQAYTLTPTWDKVSNADFYEIEFGEMMYSTIRDTALLFEDLSSETDYTFRLRAANKGGNSAWTEVVAKTKNNPLEFAIQGIVAESTAKDQGGSRIGNLFDFDESKGWHTKWGINSLPFEMIIDLKTINTLDKFHYVPRGNAGNGTLLAGSISYSSDRENWTNAGEFEWERSGDVKVFPFESQPKVRYIKVAITDAVGGFGSGSELYVFKVPNTPSYIPGDINNDKIIDRNDLTSYTNYTGLRSGDADFEGYISNGDINQNGLIDAYDISLVATELEGGVKSDKSEKVGGTIEIRTDKMNYNKGEIVKIKVRGRNLSSVNALSFALPYNSQDLEFVAVEPVNMKQMENLSNDRLHTNGVKALYPTFVNLGEKDTLDGDLELFVLKFKAKRKVKFDLRLLDGILVDRSLNYRKF